MNVLLILFIILVVAFLVFSYFSIKSLGIFGLLLMVCIGTYVWEEFAKPLFDKIINKYNEH